VGGTTGRGERSGWKLRLPFLFPLSSQWAIVARQVPLENKNGKRE